MLSAEIPIGKGEPATGVREPLPESMEKTEILLVPEFATYKKPPAESIVRSVGPVPPAVGVRGVTSVKDPSLAIVKSETSFSPEFAA
jgi:hypothetical protein